MYKRLTLAIIPCILFFALAGCIGSSVGSNNNNDRDNNNIDSGPKNILGFNITNQMGTTIINNATNLTSLTPTITVSTGADVSPESKVAQNFTSPVIYTVTAEDSTT